MRPVTETSPTPAAPPASIPEDFTLPLDLQDSRTERRARHILFSGSAAVVVAVAWASFTPIQETAYAPGELAPSGQTRTIQHLEGGVISEILARDGTLVEAGQAIVMLSASGAASDLGMLRVRRDSLIQQLALADALLDGKEPPSANGPNRSVFEARTRSRDMERRALSARAEQRRAELQLLEADAAHLSRLVAIHREQVDMRNRLAVSGYASRRQVLESEAQLELARQNLAANAGRQSAAREALAEAEQQLAAGDAEARRQWSEERAKIASELGEVEEGLRKHQDRFERLVVRAPVRGTVLQMLPRSPGEVVKPGDPIARFVPSSEPLVADLRLKPNDIAHVRAGDTVRLTLAGTDPRVAGTLTGRISSISATSFKSEQGEPYFRAEVALDMRSASPQMPQLVPGMVVRAEIVTGAKTLLRYLLRPVFDTVEVAFSER
jgi:adhesin transport system membrane fusion protein